jgi:hypothetical protein
MPIEDLHKKLQARPFRPFRIHLSDGAAYDVMHPELLLLGRRSLVLGLASRPEETVYERTIDIDLIRIVRMEQIETTAPRGNGDS